MSINQKSPKLELLCEGCQLGFNPEKNVPKMLRCGHTICLECIKRLQKAKVEKCPFDKKTISFDDDKLVNNFFLLSLIETHEKYLIESTTIQAETLNLNPKAVINSPGWKNTVDGFILDNNILISAETNGFIYCTDLHTSEWWFLYLNQFCAKFLFKVKENMYCIDFSGNLYQIFLKNYYVQIGRKGSWRNTTHVCVVNNRLFTIENNSKIYETSLEDGKWKEIFNLDTSLFNKDGNNGWKKKNSNQPLNTSSNGSGGSGSNSSSGSFNFSETFELDPSENESFDNSRRLKAIFTNGKSIFIINKNFELYDFDPIKFLNINKNCVINKKIDLHCVNSTHIYFVELYGKIVFRARINEDNFDEMIEKESMEQKLKKCSNSIDFLGSLDPFKSIEFFYDLGDVTPNKLICNDNKLVVIDKQGALLTIDLKKFSAKHSECRFMIRNCHISNLAILGDGNLLILDPIRLSLNKLNIISGSEVIILHSQKFLNTIKYLFTNGVSKVFLIDVSGNLFYFNETEKKLIQTGNTNICKNLQKFALFKNFLYVQMEEDNLLKINLNDGNHTELKLSLAKNSDYIFSDSVNFVIVSARSGEVFVTNPLKDFKVMRIINHDFSSVNTITLFKNNLIMYNTKTRNIEGINIEDGSFSVLVREFPEVFAFINNFECLACILKDGIIYTLYY